MADKSNGKMENKVLRSNTSLHEIRLSIGILRKKCLFCEMGRKRANGVEQRLVNVETKNLKRISRNTLIERMIKS